MKSDPQLGNSRLEDIYGQKEFKRISDIFGLVVTGNQSQYFRVKDRKLDSLRHKSKNSYQSCGK